MIHTRTRLTTFRPKAKYIALLLMALTFTTTPAQNSKQQSTATPKKTIKHKKTVAKKHKKKNHDKLMSTDIFPPTTYTPNPGYPQPVSDIPDSIRIYDKVDEPAQFPGGISALYEFIGKNLTYPPSAREASIQGKVIIGFIVEKTGNLSEIKVVRALEPDFDNEALRVVSIMPPWIPAKIKNVPVRSFCYLPIVFKLEE